MGLLFAQAIHVVRAAVNPLKAALGSPGSKR